MMNNGKNIVLLIVVGLICGLIGYLLGTKTPIGQINGVTLPVTSSGNLDIFTSASATVQGTIVNVEKNVATIKTKRGTEGKYTVANQVGVYTMRPGIKQASASAGLSSELMNRELIISLNYQNEHFEIVSVSIIPDVVVAPASPSAKKK